MSADRDLYCIIVRRIILILDAMSVVTYSWHPLLYDVRIGYRHICLNDNYYSIFAKTSKQIFILRTIHSPHTNKSTPQQHFLIRTLEKNHILEVAPYNSLYLFNTTRHSKLDSSSWGGSGLAIHAVQTLKNSKSFLRSPLTPTVSCTLLIGGHEGRWGRGYAVTRRPALGQAEATTAISHQHT